MRVANSSRAGISTLESIFGVIILLLVVVFTWLIVGREDDRPKTVSSAPEEEFSEPVLRGRDRWRGREGDAAGDAFGDQSFADAEASGLGQDWLARDGGEAAGEAGATSSSRLIVEVDASLRDHFAAAFSDPVRPDWSRFLSLARDLDADELPEAWSLLKEQPWSREKQDTMKSFVEYWAQTDPEAAIEFGQSLESSYDRRMVISASVRVWAASDPEAAMAWYDEQKESGKRIRGSSLLRGLYEGAPELALARVWAMEDTHRQSSALRSLFLSSHEEYKEGADKLHALFESSEDPAHREVLAKMVADVWAREDPMRAIAWAETLGDEPDIQKRVLVSAAEAWGRREPEAAMAWVQEQGLVEGNKRLVENIARSWTHDNPASLQRWIDSAPASSGRDAMVSACVRGFMYRDPGRALAMAESISEEEARYKAMGSVASHWMHRDKNGAVAAVLASSMPEEMKRKYAMKMIPAAQKRPGTTRR